MDTHTGNSNRRIARNMLFLYSRMLLIMIVGLFTSRIILQTLGIVDYGIHNVVGGIVTMFGFINGAMWAGTQRFLTFALGKENELEANRVFCTSILIHALVALTVLVLAETVGLWFLYEELVIPAERFTAALWVYQGAILSTVIVILTIPYNALIIAKEEMSAFAYISLVEVMLRLIIVYMLWIGDMDKLVLYSILGVIVQLILSGCYALYCLHHFIAARYRFLWDKQLYLNMTRFSFWTLNGSVAMVGCTQGLNILLNLFFGPAVNAARGVAVTVQSKVMLFCNNFQEAFKPQITKSYANGELERMHRLVIASSKFSYFLLLMISLPVMLNISILLRLWLGVVPEYTAEFVIIMILTTLIRTLASPLLASVHATGNIKRFQLWEGTTLLLVLPVAYLLLKYVGISPIWTMAVYLMGEIVAQVIRLRIILPMIKMRMTSYLQQVICPIILVTIFAVLPPAVIRMLYFSDINSISSFIIILLLSIVSVCAASFFIGCKREEKLQVVLYITQYRQK